MFYLSVWGFFLTCLTLTFNQNWFTSFTNYCYNYKEKTYCQSMLKKKSSCLYTVITVLFLVCFKNIPNLFWRTPANNSFES